MTALAEVAGTITAVLGLSHDFVQRHVVGLRKAGRLSGNYASPTEASELLCACMASDGNATGPFNLPFVGGTLPMSSPVITIGPGHSLFEEMNRPFGETVAGLIESAALSTYERRPINKIHVGGRSHRLYAYVEMDPAPFGLEGSSVAWWFGYLPCWELVAEVATPTPYLTYACDLGDTVFRELGATLRGDMVATAVPSLLLERAAQDRVLH